MKKQPKSEEETLALTLIKGRDSDGHVKVLVRLCTIYRKDNGKRAPYSPERADGYYIRGLGVTHYWSEYGGGHLMLGGLEYTDLHSAKEGQLAEMLSTIRRVQKAVAKVVDSFGCNEFADEHLAVLALALGVTVVFVYDGGLGGYEPRTVIEARTELCAWVAGEKDAREDRRRAGIGM